jgi:homoserine dehydrogenase
MANAAVLGYGTVGSGVVETLDINKDIIKLRAGEEINVKHILDIRDFENDPYGDLITKDFEKILNDDSITVVAETMGGLEPAYGFTKRCLERGKSVVTSNKELVERHGAYLLELAAKNNANYLFEASVGGGIPIIRAMNQSLTPEDINEISGILNGTTNYILTRMKNAGLSFKDALKEAQDKGYAEKVPDADVLGHDALRKIAILSSLAFFKDVDYDDLYCEGITNISITDMKYADAIDSEIKLVARAKKTDKGFYAMVSPLIIKRENPLSNVHGVFNAVLIKGNIIGDALFYGSGAGKFPTASAVTADIIDCVKHKNTIITQIWSREKIKPIDISEVESKFFVRFKSCDNQINELKSVFNYSEIIRLAEYSDEFAIITGLMNEKEFAEKASQFKEFAIHSIRVE